MNKYKVVYKDMYGETHNTKVEANSEREAETKFNEYSPLDVIVSLVIDK